jgi:Mg-chelatase subunit ChlI
MNPEEGDLRPQLLDRFGMVVDVVGESDPEMRMKVIKNRLEYEKDKEIFATSFKNEQEALKEKIQRAKKLLDLVHYSDEMLEIAVNISIELGVDGHRADISMIKTAMTIAAFRGATEVTVQDMMEAAELVLPHRMRRTPFEDGRFDLNRIGEIVEAVGSRRYGVL